MEHLHILELEGGTKKAFIHVILHNDKILTTCRLWPIDDPKTWSLQSAYALTMWMHDILGDSSRKHELCFMDCNVGGEV
jgi:hypothetical protein